MILPRYGFGKPVSRLRDREDAARRLSEALAPYRGTRPLILGIPRGGVVVAKGLARSLEGELDVVLVRKLRAPEQPEFALGSITESGSVSLSEGAPQIASREYLDREAAEALELLKRRRKQYTPLRPPADPSGRIVIVVDDGIATGSTMLAALASIREREPKRLIAAAAVAPAETLSKLEEVADEVVCVLAPPEFRAVSQFFEDFSEVSDEEVRDLLRASSGSDYIWRAKNR
jgi:predicted phosphoribosyltransferase